MRKGLNSIQSDGELGGGRHGFQSEQITERESEEKNQCMSMIIESGLALVCSLFVVVVVFESVGGRCL